MLNSNRMKDLPTRGDKEVERGMGRHLETTIELKVYRI